MTTAGYGLYATNSQGKQGYVAEGGLLVEWSTEAQVFPSLDAAHREITRLGYHDSTSVITGRATAYVVEFSQ